VVINAEMIGIGFDHGDGVGRTDGKVRLGKITAQTDLSFCRNPMN
jgi:hypothetical protein